MVSASKTSPQSVLRYRLAPGEEARTAIDETLAAYQRMADILGDLVSGRGGANLVVLHDLAYETVREQTGLPARLVTLGLRDFASGRAHEGGIALLPLDEKLFAIKGPSDLTIATVRGRVAVPFDVAGYSPGWDNVFPAYLTVTAGRYEIHIGVTPNSPRMEENMNEGVLSRMGRLIAGIANAAIDKAEGTNKLAIIEQAIREIDAAADEARTDLGKARAEEYRIASRRTEITADMDALDEKIRLAVSSGRDDLAKAGVSRQIDLEAQIAALDKALADAKEHVDEGQKALQAVLATRREAEARLSDYKRSIAQHAPESSGGTTIRPQPGVSAAKAAAAVSRVTGVPSGEVASSAELDELDRLHREQAIEARLARFKAGNQ